MKNSGISINENKMGIETVDLMNLLKQSAQITSGQIINENSIKGPSLCISYFNLIQIGVFSQNEEVLKTFKECICFSLKPEALKLLVKELVDVQYAKKFTFPALVLDLIEFRVKFLEENAPVAPKFSWHMSGIEFPSTQFDLRKKTQLLKNTESLKRFIESENQHMLFNGGVNLS